MKKFLTLLLSLTFCFAMLVPLNAYAEGVQYGQLFGASQPIIVDWSAYASIGKHSRVTLIDLRTKGKQVLKEGNSDKVTSVWTVYNISKKSSYSVTVDVLDEYGTVLRSVTDYFHIGDFFVNPPAEPKEKLNITSPPMQNQVFTSAMWALWNSVNSVNPSLSSINVEPTSSSWLSRNIGPKFPLDALNVILLTSRVNGAKINSSLEADLFKRANVLRAQSGKKTLQWNNKFGKLNRLRAVAFCDETPGDSFNSGELQGTLTACYGRYGMNCGDATECIAFFPGNPSAANIMKELSTNNKFMTGLLSDRKFLAITAVSTAKLGGNRVKGIAVFATFAN